MRSSMGKFLAAALVSLLVASPVAALEKRAARLDDTHGDAWRGAGTCSLVYYNFCTGWVWLWSGWEPSEVIGVAFESCCDPGEITSVISSYVYFSRGAPTGYGFTGTMDVFDADAERCPTGAPVASQPFLPAETWNLVVFGGVAVPDPTFAVAVTFGTGDSNPSEIATDHPAAVIGDPLPAACGYCYPTTRATRTYYWGTSTSPLCPGSVLSDGVCDAELLLDVAVTCSIVSVDPTGWGRVKNLYR